MERPRADEIDLNFVPWIDFGCFKGQMSETREWTFYPLANVTFFNKVVDDGAHRSKIEMIRNNII